MPEPSRQLAAIMFTDIVGYTKLMGEDSNKALELVRISKEIQKPLVEKHNGKWLKEMGDGAMAQFGSALDAVKCAVAIQKSARGELDAKLRIGIHLGDVTVEENDVHGDGVNVASRLESIADPGGIYISDAIEKAIRGQTEIHAKYLGERRLNNVDYGVRTYAVQGVGLPIPEVSQEKQLSGRFWAEMQRRGVVRAGVAYLVVALLLILLLREAQIWLTLPDLSFTILVTALAVGFPMAMYLAWNYERSPEGFVRTSSPQSWQNPYKASQKKPLTSNFIIAGMALIIVVMYVYPRYVANPPEDAGTISNSVMAVFPFTIHGGDELNYLKEGMANLLTTKLDGAGKLRCVDFHSLLGLVNREADSNDDPENNSLVARRFGAGIFIIGDLVQAGIKLQINAIAYSTENGKEIGSGEVEGEVTEIFELIDDLAAQLLSDLNPESDARVQRIAAVTTSSLQAYKDYLRGERALRQGQFQLAIDAFKNAINEDSLFALAYYRLSIAAEWNFEGELARQTAEKALFHASRLSDRDRQLLEAFLLRTNGANEEAEQLYRSILASYPHDIEVWMDLGEIMNHANPLRGRSFVESREVLERILSYDPDHWGSLIHLARVSAFESNTEELDSIVDKFMSLHPQENRELEILALQAFYKNDENEQEQMIEKLRRSGDLSLALGIWTISVYARNFEGAKRVGRLLADENRSIEGRTIAHAWLAHLHLVNGHWQMAMEEIEAMAAFSPGVALEYQALLYSLPFLPQGFVNLEVTKDQLENLDPSTIPNSNSTIIVFNAHNDLHSLIRTYLLGLINAKLGQADLALQQADQLEQLDAGPGTLGVDLALSINAQIAIEENRTQEALSILEQTRAHIWYGQTMASPYYSYAYQRFIRAELLFELGRYHEALPWYEYLTEISPFELVYLPISHLRRGQIYEQLGQTENARSHYARFIELWRDSDSDFQFMVNMAEKNLKALQNGEVSK